MLLDGGPAGEAIVAVGEQGTILRSSDLGKSWQSSERPVGVTATLTGVTFADAQFGWAVGHDALILASTDGGVRWSRQWQGENLSDSFLDVLALDNRHVIAVGAYGLFVVTSDGGATWQHRKIIPDDFHLNRISRGPTGTLYLAGEHGTLLRSSDAGSTWVPIPTSYEGSFYGVLPVGDRMLLAYGLRGRVFRSNDDGASWTEIKSGTSALLATAITLRPGTAILAGQARAFLVGQDGDPALARADLGLEGGVAELLLLANGSVLALGEEGATVVPKERLASIRPRGATGIRNPTPGSPQATAATLAAAQRR